MGKKKGSSNGVVEEEKDLQWSIKHFPNDDMFTPSCFNPCSMERVVEGNSITSVKLLNAIFLIGTHCRGSEKIGDRMIGVESGENTTD